MSIEYTELEFEADCEERGYEALQELYTPTHLFFCNKGVPHEQKVKVARMGVTELEARVRFARTTARNRSASERKGAAKQQEALQRPHAHVAARGIEAAHGASPSAADELRGQLRAANERLEEQEEELGHGIARHGR